MDGMATVSQALAAMKLNDADVVIVSKRHGHDADGIVLLSDIAKKVLAKNYSPDRINLYEIMATEFAETIDQSQLDSAFHRAQTSATKWEYDLRCRGKTLSPHISMECRCLCRFQMPIQLQKQ